MNQQQKIIVTIGMALLLGIILLVQFRPKKKSASIAALVEVAPVLPAVAAAVKEKTGTALLATTEELAKQKKRSTTEWGDDPFYRSMQKEIYKSSSLVLKGISLAKDRPSYATVNDQILTLGDQIAGYFVKEIQYNKILLQKGNEKFYLVLPEEQY
jgi:hypothetical protein